MFKLQSQPNKDYYWETWELSKKETPYKMSFASWQSLRTIRHPNCLGFTGDDKKNKKKD